MMRDQRTANDRIVQRLSSIDSDYDISDLSDIEDICDVMPVHSDQSELTTEQTQLWSAANDGNYLDCRMLLEDGVSPNYLHPEAGNTPLHVAVENGHYDIVKLIISQDICDIDMKDKLGRTALMEATIFDDVEMAHILRKGGANLDAVDTTGKTALLLGLQDACKHTALYLMRHGCDVNIVDQLGQSALYLLLNSMDLEVVKLVKRLIKSGYDVSKDKAWLQDEGMDVETVRRSGFLSKLASKLTSSLSSLTGNKAKVGQRAIYAESSYGSKMVRIFKTYE